MKLSSLNGSGGGESSPPPATEPSNGFKKPQKRTIEKLDRQMLDDAEALISEWTGGEVDTINSTWTLEDQELCITLSKKQPIMWSYAVNSL